MSSVPSSVKRRVSSRSASTRAKDPPRAPEAGDDRERLREPRASAPSVSEDFRSPRTSHARPVGDFAHCSHRPTGRQRAVAQRTQVFGVSSRRSGIPSRSGLPPRRTIARCYARADFVEHSTASSRRRMAATSTMAREASVAHAAGRRTVSPPRQQRATRQPSAARRARGAAPCRRVTAWPADPRRRAGARRVTPGWQIWRTKARAAASLPRRHVVFRLSAWDRAHLPHLVARAS